MQQPNIIIMQQFNVLIAETQLIQVDGSELNGVNKVNIYIQIAG